MLHSKASLLSLVCATTALFLTACGSSESPAGQSSQQLTCTTLYVVENGRAGKALNEMWPNDGGIYCAENVGQDGCIGNYCGENKGWTKDPNFVAPAPACTTLYVVENGRAGKALNEMWPNDGGIYCAENVSQDGCIGNYCGENKDWTKDPNFGH